MLGAGYGLGLGARDSLDPMHTATMEVRLDYSGLMAGASLGWGTSQQDFEAWNSKVNAITSELRAGYGFDLGPTRLTTGGCLGLSRLWQEFDDGQNRTGWSIRAGALASLLYPATGWIAVELSIRGGGSYVPGAGAQADSQWTGWAGGGLSVWFRVH
jgi:hypothetical protein